MGADLRALILERLPLFLHDQTHARIRISYQWLSDSSNFIVKTFGKLFVTKKLDYDGHTITNTQDMTAVSQRIGTGPVELWLDLHTRVDMFESVFSIVLVAYCFTNIRLRVSTALCNMLFEKHKNNDSLLLGTILSMDLQALRRRGYNGRSMNDVLLF